MIEFFKRLFNCKSNKVEDSVKLYKEYKQYSIPYNKPFTTTSNEYKIKAGSLIKEINLVSFSESKGSIFYVFVNYSDGDKVLILTESDLKNSNNKIIFNEYFNIDVDCNIIIECLGSGTGTGILLVEFFE